MPRKLFNPHGYQKKLIAHQLLAPRGATWAGMGTGKTVSTLSTLDILHCAGDLQSPALVLAPLRVAQSTWPDEVAKWEHLSHMEVTPIVGSAQTRHRKLFWELARGNSSVFSINYENVEWLKQTLADARMGWPFEVVIADESTRLKGFRTRQGTKRAKALGQIAHSKAKRWINLSGTPTPNGLKDLWGQQWFLDGGASLGRSYKAFKDRWFKKGYDSFSIEPLPHAEKEIHAAIADLCLSVDHELDTDEPLTNRIYVDLPSKARQQYREMEKAMFTNLAGVDLEAFSAGARTLKCLQIANGAVWLGDPAEKNRQWAEVHTAKIDALESIIEEASGAPVLVAYHFRPDLVRLLKAFPKARELDSNPQTIRDWNAGKIPILIAHPASTGHGLNLQDGGNILVFFSVDWNLEFHDQIIERIGPVRQKQAGHDRPVFVHYILAIDTIEDAVMDRLIDKRSVQDVLLEAMRRRE